MDDNWIPLGLIAWGGLGLLLVLVFMHKDRASNRHRHKKEKAMTVAEGRKLLAKSPDSEPNFYVSGETILEAGQIELVPFIGDGDGFVATFNGARDDVTRVAVMS
jgi:hypothetical protein